MFIEYNEILAMLMEDRPEFATDLYNWTEGPELPEYDDIAISRQTIVPSRSEEQFRVCALAAYSKGGEQVVAVLFDTVLGPDLDQAECWLQFIENAQRALSCMVAFVVLCRDATTADWARDYSAVGDIGHYVLPVVVPSLLPST
ncbi:hypothetical protein [Glycomyces arizonensis]|uniref:hypothetical protein n=1 Tax=Glycomyces arizonensis TaxID=256035 RepID=UPI0004042BFB|nr:hypothetical protein [Glycomyces arizonensis]